MFRYILSLLLINTSYQSLGAPTNINATQANLMVSLANRCENAFLTNQIKSQVDSCSDLKVIGGEKQLRCLMFYDMSNQLCSAVNDAKLAITEDYTEKINEELNVNSLCEHTKDWAFSIIPEYPRYKQAVDKVFKHPVTCGNICGVEEILSDDANFYCKYYNWGFGMLKQKVSTQVAPALVPLEDKVSETKPVVSVPGSNDLADLQIKVGEPKSSEAPPAKNTEKTESPPTNVHQPSNPPSATSEKVTQTKVPVAPENPIEEEKPSEMAAVKADASDTAADETKPEPLEDAQHKPEESLKTSVDKEIQLLNNELEKKEAAVIENPKGKIPNDPEDYQDSDEGKEGLGDMQGGDDGEDPILEDVNNKPVKQGETDYYTNPIQEGLSADEDNFFPFFLTAIILVVLFYILYHNKSKVTKWFFGLVLEGRQSNRRRTSRGHAYKRLDTLEQAMSTNTAAPPSKIIY